MFYGAGTALAAGVFLVREFHLGRWKKATGTVGG